MTFFVPQQAPPIRNSVPIPQTCIIRACHLRFFGDTVCTMKEKIRHSGAVPRAVAISYNWETSEIHTLAFDGECCIQQAEDWINGTGITNSASQQPGTSGADWVHFWHANCAALELLGHLERTRQCKPAADRSPVLLSAECVERFSSVLRELVRMNREFARHRHYSTASLRCETGPNAAPVLPSSLPVIVCP